MSNLNPDQFAPWGYATPKDKHGNSLYPQKSPTHDDVPQVKVESPEHFSQIVQGKMAHRFDADSYEYKRTKVHRWHLDRDTGEKRSTSYPPGWSEPIT